MIQKIAEKAQNTWKNPHKKVQFWGSALLELGWKVGMSGKSPPGWREGGWASAATKYIW